jgi:hypothetical protein
VSLDVATLHLLYVGDYSLAGRVVHVYRGGVFAEKQAEVLVLIDFVLVEFGLGLNFLQNFLQGALIIASALQLGHIIFLFVFLLIGLILGFLSLPVELKLLFRTLLLALLDQILLVSDHAVALFGRLIERLVFHFIQLPKLNFKLAHRFDQILTLVTHSQY